MVTFEHVIFNRLTNIQAWHSDLLAVMVARGTYAFASLINDVAALPLKALVIRY